MGYRRFTDREGNVWEVRDRSKREWQLEPVRGNPKPPVTASAPGYESDPFELSIEELQRLLDSAQPAPSRPRKSPFRD
ncbi:MAG: hypothetical protein GTN62_09700 [Gemmatimonadales bacterium]|nr:hypothetical protein [Gemmatimonadales bacterium]NIN11819.1 hypothetical protein [Gemmatimonadales bacterium]NIN50369.1 hypothetical protein [Gemmatimonadales bacterium]NIP07833.1 hypothetical protein [Gemmatimonadales bacterium]NIR00541.1 hypothetical protein [Gemmatimonadales bacterium]